MHLPSFDRLLFYKGHIPKAIVGLWWSDSEPKRRVSRDTMTRASNFVSRPHPRTCQIFKPRTRRKFDSHIERIARFSAAHIIRISITCRITRSYRRKRKDGKKMKMSITRLRSCDIRQHVQINDYFGNTALFKLFFSFLYGFFILL